jgi:hypothetical protein
MLLNNINFNTITAFTGILAQTILLYHWNNNISKQISSLDKIPRYINLSNTRVINTTFIEYIDHFEPNIYKVYFSNNTNRQFKDLIGYNNFVEVSKDNDFESYNAIDKWVKRLN